MRLRDQWVCYIAIHTLDIFSSLAGFSRFLSRVFLIFRSEKLHSNLAWFTDMPSSSNAKSASSQTAGVVQNAFHMERGLVPCGFKMMWVPSNCFLVMKTYMYALEALFIFLPIFEWTFRAQVTQKWFWDLSLLPHPHRIVFILFFFRTGDFGRMGANMSIGLAIQTVKIEILYTEIKETYLQ